MKCECAGRESEASLARSADYVLTVAVQIRNIERHVAAAKNLGIVTRS